MGALLLVASFLASGCREYFDPTGAAFSLAKEKGWIEAAIDTGPYVLTSFQKKIPPGPQTGILRIYIEGDGNSFTAGGRPTSDPTPIRPIAFQLALADDSEAVAYLGRPCQYTSDRTAKGCDVRQWTSHRFSDQAVLATDRAVSHLKGKFKADRVVLIGFSGGGAIATLLAARRSDVAALVTVAGTLDHRLWTELHLVNDLTGSLNPVSVAPGLRRLPQVHFVGSDDRVMPKTIAESYMRASGPNAAARLVVVPDADHECCWAEMWPRLLGDLAGRGPNAGAGIRSPTLHPNSSG
jgi:dienelactone hydrolase